MHKRETPEDILGGFFNRELQIRNPLISGPSIGLSLYLLFRSGSIVLIEVVDTAGNAVNGGNRQGHGVRTTYQLSAILQNDRVLRAELSIARAGI